MTQPNKPLQQNSKNAELIATGIDVPEMGLILESLKYKKVTLEEKIAIAIASHNHIEEACERSKDEISTWVEVDLLARNEERDDLLIQAVQHGTCQNKTEQLKTQINQLTDTINSLRRELSFIEQILDEINNQQMLNLEKIKAVFNDFLSEI